jgi:hypothetical protein
VIVTGELEKMRKSVVAYFKAQCQLLPAGVEGKVENFREAQSVAGL